MKYVEFRDRIRKELLRNPSGLTWKELKDRCRLPYDRPCQNWVERLEHEIGLLRWHGTGRALVWTVDVKGKKEA